MKKRMLALAMAVCLMLSLLPTAVFAEGDEPTPPTPPACTCETACTADAMNKDCPVCGADNATVGSCCGKSTTTTPEPTDVEKVQTLIDALPTEVTAENKDEVQTKLTAIDEAMKDFTDEQRGQLTLTNYTTAKESIEKLNTPATPDPAPQPAAKSYEETLRDEISKAEYQKTVTLKQDVTLTEPLTPKKGITVDLAGHSITLGNGVTTAFRLDSVSITITNSSNKVGTVYGNNDIEADDCDDSSAGTGKKGVYAVTFKLVKDGETFATQYVKDGNTAIKLDAPKKDGHAFEEWQKKITNTSPDESTGNVSETITYGTYNFDEEVKTHITLVAVYTPDTYTITFDPNGGTLDESEKTATANKDNEWMITSLPTPTWEGHTFLGWFTQAEGGEQIKPNVKVYTADTPLYAQWESDAFTITFNTNNGASTFDNGTTDKDGKLTAMPKDPTRTGYTFDDWYTEKTGGTKVTMDTVFAENTTIYAHWTANTYTIVFKNGTSQKTQKMTYGVEAELNANTFTKDGCTFADWNTKENGTGKTYTDKQKVSNLTDENEGEFVLYAQWVENTTPELTPVTSLSFSQSGYEYGEKVMDIVVTSSTKNTGIEFEGGKLAYGDNYGITTKQTATVATSSGTFKGKEYNKTCTDYFLYVEFQAADGYELDLDPADVKLDGVAAVALTGNAEKARAVFKLPTIYLIKAEAGKNGKIEPSGTVAVFEGEDVTFTITPNTGYGISTMKIDGKNKTTKKTYEFKDVDDGHTIAVTFAKSNGSAKTGDDLRLIWLAGAGVLSLAALVTLVIVHNKKKNSK